MKPDPDTASEMRVVDAEVDRGPDEMIVAQDVKTWFGGFQALDGINLTIRRGEVVVVMGPSGSGKSTLIRCFNRLERHDAGRIVIDGLELTDDMRNIERIRSEIGMVFQSFNLFPHLTVMDNVTLAPRNVRHWPRKKSEDKAMQLLERVGIPEQAGKYPAQLSGGQQQRVAIARALLLQSRERTHQAVPVPDPDLNPAALPHGGRNDTQRLGLAPWPRPSSTGRPWPPRSRRRWPGGSDH